MVTACLLYCLLAFQEDHHYIDGTVLTLRNGTVIKTAYEVKEDRFFYSWREEGTYISIEKQKVKSVDYFSVLVPGPAPRIKVQPAIMRRISGASVAYEVRGATMLKCRHVDVRGRSTEGGFTYNRVEHMKVAGEPGQGYRPMEARFSKVTKGTQAKIRIYSLKGELLYQTEFEVDEVSRSRREKREGTMTYKFQMPAEIDPQQVGLVEIISRKA